jgi:hypothetical protein
METYPACSSYAGIDYTGASGSILNNIIRNIYVSPETTIANIEAGCGSGRGIDGNINNNVYTETIMISNNVIPNYSDAGIWCTDAGVTCLITNNDVSFYAAYSSLEFGPGGIAIYPGASATVAMNTISGNICTSAIALSFF